MGRGVVSKKEESKCGGHIQDKQAFSPMSPSPRLNLLSQRSSHYSAQWIFTWISWQLARDRELFVSLDEKEVELRDSLAAGFALLSLTNFSHKVELSEILKPSTTSKIQAESKTKVDRASDNT